MAKEGNFVKINFTGATKEDGKIFDTTLEEKAKEAGIHDKRVRYGPVLVPVGRHQVITGLDEELANAKKGDKKQITLAPDKAFGKRNTESVKLVPESKFKEQKVKPFIGMPVEIDGMRAKVQSISGGRVRVDFNHPLAGKEITYDYEVLEVLEKPEEKFKALAEDLLPGSKASYENNECTVIVPEKVDKASRDYLIKKTRLYVQAFEFIPEVKKMHFNEEWGAPTLTPAAKQAS